MSPPAQIMIYSLNSTGVPRTQSINEPGHEPFSLMRPHGPGRVMLQVGHIWANAKTRIPFGQPSRGHNWIWVGSLLSWVPSRRSDFTVEIISYSTFDLMDTKLALVTTYKGVTHGYIHTGHRSNNGRTNHCIGSAFSTHMRCLIRAPYIPYMHTTIDLCESYRGFAENPLTSQ